MNWFNIKNIEEIDTPALLIYKDRATQNIGKALSLVHSVKQLRPYVKTHKLLGISQMMIDAGIHKFKCATIAEAEMLGQLLTLAVPPKLTNNPFRMLKGLIAFESLSIAGSSTNQLFKSLPLKNLMVLWAKVAVEIRDNMRISFFMGFEI